MPRPLLLLHRRSVLPVLLLVLVNALSACSTLRRWIVPPQTHSESAAVAYNQPRSSQYAELIVAVAQLPGAGTEETAVAVRDGRILARGTLAELERVRGEATRTIRLPGGVATAGLVAAHVQLERAAMATDNVDLRGCKSVADVVNTLKIAKPMVLTDGGWLWADGLALGIYEKLSAADLDGAVGRTSVLVTPSGKPAGHGGVGLVNGGMLARLGDLGTTLAEHGGQLDERQLDLVWQQLPPTRPERLKPLLMALFADLQRQGITEIHAFAASQAGLDALHLLDRESRLTLRTRVYLDAERPEGRALLQPPAKATPDAMPQRQEPPPSPQRKRVPMVQVAGVSLSLDGSVRAGAAAMTEPYADLPFAATLTYSDDLLRERLGAADRAGVAVAIRASGDAALAQLTRVLATLARTEDAPQLRVELPEVVSPATLEALQAAHARCVIAPVLATKELDGLKRRLGTERWLWFERAASLAAACPLQVALDVTHPEALRSHDRLTRHGAQDPEALAPQQAWRALSSGGTGRTTPPMQVDEDADFVVWTRDPLLPGKTPAKVMASVVGGTVTLLIGRDANGE